MDTKKKLLITIDGPAGAGKTTVSRILAKRLKYNYIDTGALYRGIAYEAYQNNINQDDDNAVKKLCENIELKFMQIDGEQYLFSNDKNIESYIRMSEISMLASSISANPYVRNSLLQLQKDLGKKKSAVFEGRDMGTIIFPDADFKFFLEASVEVRALRRYKQIANNNFQTLEEVKADIIKRDKNDSSRDLAPLKPADDAIIIDSSKMSIEEVINLMFLVIFD